MSWSLAWGSHGEYTSVWLHIEQNLLWIMMQGYQIVMIHQATMLYGLSNLRGYWFYVKINRRLWLISETNPKVDIYSLWIGTLLMKVGSHRYSQQRRHMISHGIEAPWYLMGLRQHVPLGYPKDMWSWNMWLY